MGQHDPDRPAQRTGKMGDRGIDCDDSIEQGDHGGGVGEVRERMRKPDQLGLRCNRRAVGLADFRLQAHE